MGDFTSVIYLIFFLLSGLLSGTPLLACLPACLRLADRPATAFFGSILFSHKEAESSRVKEALDGFSGYFLLLLPPP